MDKYNSLLTEANNLILLEEKLLALKEKSKIIVAYTQQANASGAHSIIRAKAIIQMAYFLRERRY